MKWTREDLGTWIVLIAVILLAWASDAHATTPVPTVEPGPATHVAQPTTSPEPRVIKQERQPNTSPSSRVSLIAGQAATIRYVDQQCKAIHCSSDAVAPASMCEHHGPRVACDFAIWTKDDTRQCDGRLVIRKAHGRLVVKLKGTMNCHGTYVLR